MVRKFSWEYRREHAAEFLYACKTCGPEDRRFKTEKDQQNHDAYEMKKRYDPDFAGSTGKGTAIRGKSDVDIVFLLPETTFSTVGSMLAEHRQILDDVQKTLISSGYNVTGRYAKALQLRVNCNEHGSGKPHRIDVDVLLAANFGKDVEDQLQEIYVKMKTGLESERKFYTLSLTKQQKEFVKKDRPETLKRLIRLVKYWKNTSIQVNL